MLCASSCGSAQHVRDVRDCDRAYATFDMYGQAVREVLTDDTFVKPPSYAENFVPVFGEHGLVTIADGPQHAGQ